MMLRVTMRLMVVALLVMVTLAACGSDDMVKTVYTATGDGTAPDSLTKTTSFRYDDDLNVAVNGCNDNKPYGEILNRAWTFRSIGYGHGVEAWKDIISALLLVGYDYVISIEHEDAMMSQDEGLAKGVAVLKEACVFEKPGEMFWA